MDKKRMLMVFSQRTRLQHHTFTKEIKMLARFSFTHLFKSGVQKPL